MVIKRPQQTIFSVKIAVAGTLNPHANVQSCNQMRKTLPAVSLPMLFASTLAHAQSSMTLHGLIDEGVDYISNVKGKSFYGLVNGETAGSRWGLKGVEDLGGG